MCSKKNAEIILKELIEYGRDIDSVIARRAIKCIGDIATMVNMAADKTIRALMNIVKDSSQQLHILNQAAITFSEILRKYPKKWGIAKCVQIMVSKIDLIQEPESLAAII